MLVLQKLNSKLRSDTMIKISTRILEDSISQMPLPFIAYKASSGMRTTTPIKPSIAMRRL